MRIHYINSMVQIARENLALALERHEEVSRLTKEWKGLEGDEADHFNNFSLIPAKTKHDNYCLVTLVVAALAVEAYICDYAARKFPASYVEDYLDKLSVGSKWVIIPKLATGKDFSSSEKALSLLRSLVKNRNYLVHHKSAPLLTSDDMSNRSGDAPGLSSDNTEEDLMKKLLSTQAKKLQKFDDALLDTANDAIKTLDELAVCMESLDPEESTSILYFRSPVGRAKQMHEEYGIWPWE